MEPEGLLGEEAAARGQDCGVAVDCSSTTGREEGPPSSLTRGACWALSGPVLGLRVWPEWGALGGMRPQGETASADTGTDNMTQTVAAK